MRDSRMKCCQNNIYCWQTGVKVNKWYYTKISMTEKKFKRKDILNDLNFNAANFYLLDFEFMIIWFQSEQIQWSNLLHAVFDLCFFVIVFTRTQPYIHT